MKYPYLCIYIYIYISTMKMGMLFLCFNFHIIILYPSYSEWCVLHVRPLDPSLRRSGEDVNHLEPRVRATHRGVGSHVWLSFKQWHMAMHMMSVYTVYIYIYVYIYIHSTFIDICIYILYIIIYVYKYICMIMIDNRPMYLICNT